MVLRGFDKEIGGIGKTCRCVMGKRAVQEKEGYLPQRQVCGLPAGARVFLWINAGAGNPNLQKRRTFLRRSPRKRSVSL